MCQLHPLTLSDRFYFNSFITPWSTVLLEKPTDFKLFKKFPAFYGTRMFITAFTRAHTLSPIT